MSRRGPRWRGVCPTCGLDRALRWGDGGAHAVGSWVMAKHGPCDGWGYDPVEGTVYHPRKRGSE